MKAQDAEAEGFNRVVGGRTAEGLQDILNPIDQLCFTAADCVKIAKAYYECARYVEYIAGEHAEPEVVAELVDWNTKFKQWVEQDPWAKP